VKVPAAPKGIDKNLNRKNSIQSQQTFGGGKRKPSESNFKESPRASEAAVDEDNLAKRNKREYEAPQQF
jgi:hypothetical protein